MGFFDSLKSIFTGEKPDAQMEETTTEFYNNSSVNGIDISDAYFVMTIDDVFQITGRGVVAVGKITKGEITVGDTVEIVGDILTPPKPARVAGLEMFRKMLDTAKEGDNVGMFLSSVTKSDVIKGYRLIKR